MLLGNGLVSSSELDDDGICVGSQRQNMLFHDLWRIVLNTDRYGDPKLLSSQQIETWACSDACLRQIEESRVIACLRARSAVLALDAARAALDGGLSVLEVTMTTPETTKVIASLVQEYPSALIGAGTVLSVEQAQMAKDAGARFLLSPVTVKELVESHAAGPVLFVPGAMTPTEVFTAFSYGAKIVKIYPVALAGGLKYLQSLKRLLNHIPVIASQGITTEMVEPYIRCGASAVVLSDAIFDSVSMANSDFSRIRKQALAAKLKPACHNQQKQGEISTVHFPK